MPRINDLPTLKKLPEGVKRLTLGSAKWQYELFLNFIIAVIAGILLVFAVLVVGVAKVGDFKVVGRIGGKTLIYFTCATLIALSLGLVIVN